MTKFFRPTPIPTLATRALELHAIGLPGARAQFRGRELNYHFSIAPGAFGRLYECVLKLLPEGTQPDLIVLQPDLSVLAAGQKIPHTYPWKGKGTSLCLWWPKGRDWVAQMKLAETYIPWTAEWLFYFEIWRKTGQWEGGGVHPDLTPKRWSRPTTHSPA